MQMFRESLPRKVDVDIMACDFNSLMQGSTPDDVFCEYHILFISGRDGYKRQEPHGSAVDVHGVLGRDEKVPAPVNDPGLHQITALRRHGDRGLGGLYLKTPGVDQVGRIEGRAGAELPVSYTHLDVYKRQGLFPLGL